MARHGNNKKKYKLEEVKAVSVQENSHIDITACVHEDLSVDLHSSFVTKRIVDFLFFFR